jgi:hypothetical protein
VLAQQVAAGDVRDAESRGEPLGLCSLAGAGSADQQKPHLTSRSAQQPSAPAVPDQTRRPPVNSHAPSAISSRPKPLRFTPSNDRCRCQATAAQPDTSSTKSGMPDIRSARSVGAQQLPGRPAGFRRSACALRAAPAHNRRRKPHGISAPPVNPHALHWSPGAGDLTCTFAAATTLCQRSSHGRARSLPDSACRACHTIHEPTRRDDANAPSFDGRFTHHRPKGARSWSAWMPPLTRFRALSITASSFAAPSALIPCGECCRFCLAARPLG